MKFKMHGPEHCGHGSCAACLQNMLRSQMMQHARAWIMHNVAPEKHSSNTEGVFCNFKCVAEEHYYAGQQKHNNKVVQSRNALHSHRTTFFKQIHANPQWHTSIKGDAFRYRKLGNYQFAKSGPGANKRLGTESLSIVNPGLSDMNHCVSWLN